MISRRVFLGTMAGGLLAAPLAAEAQQAVKIPRIGYLGPTYAAGGKHLLDAFREGMRELGYVEGKNIVIEYRWAEGKYDRFPDLAAELVRLKLDLIVAVSTPALKLPSARPRRSPS